MNITTKTLLTSVAILSLLLTGCSESDGYSSSNQTSTTDPVVNPYQSAGWYGKTKISVNFTDIDNSVKVLKHTTAGVFGELKQSSDDKDQHDVPGYGPAVFQIIMIPEFSTDTSAGFFTEYKNYNPENSDKKVWTFQIKQQSSICLEVNPDDSSKCNRWMDLKDSPIAINLEGVYDVEYRDDRGSVEYKESSTVDTEKVIALTLVDVDIGTKYTVEELASANLTMNGLHVRTFRWVVGPVDSTDYEALSSPQRAARRTASSEFQVAPDSNTGGKFGLPPQ